MKSTGYNYKNCLAGSLTRVSFLKKFISKELCLKGGDLPV